MRGEVERRARQGSLRGDKSKGKGEESDEGGQAEKKREVKEERMGREGNMEVEKAKRETEEKVGQTSKKSRGLNTGPPQHGGKASGEGGREADREKV